jgi:beta-carotene ketolase (CrtO type)
VVIGAGHNGLVCATYLARAGLEVAVVEASDPPGGCIDTRDLPGGRGRLELGAYEHGGIVGSGVAADLELESRFGLRMHRRDEVTLGPCDDGTALAFHASLQRTVEGLAAVVGTDEAQRYRALAGWATAAMDLLRTSEAGPPPTLRELAALADATLGAGGRRLIRDLLAPASNVLRTALRDPRLQGVIAHWAAHSQQSPADPGTGIGALAIPGGHGVPASRPAGGSQATIAALARALQAAGGTLSVGTPVTAVQLNGGRARCVVAGDEQIAARRAVVSAIDARRLLLDLVGEAQLPRALADEVQAIHTGSRNVSEIKVDAVIEALPEIPGPPGFERSFMLSPNTLGDTERAFARIALGELPERGPLMIAFPSTLEAGWAPAGRHVMWLSTFVPWTPTGGRWTPKLTQQAADLAWSWAERALGGPIQAVERRVTGPLDWVARNGNACACPNHVDMSLDQLLGNRPSPSLSRYRTPLRGLYLTGAGTHPGGGITGVPGRNAAAVVLEDVGVGGASWRSRMHAARARAALLRDTARAARNLRRAA